MEKIECGILTCIHCKKFYDHYGYCESPNNIVLKWRLAADLGKGMMIMLECLNMTLPEKEAN